jgi:TolB-like protein
MVEGEVATSPRINLAGVSDFLIGSVRVRPARRQLLLRPDEVRSLEPRVMQVLVALAQAGGEVVSRDQLNELCWDGRVVGDDAVNRCILVLRRIARSIDPPPFEIETVPRVGYALKVPDGGLPAPASKSASEPAPAGAAKSIAVLPFANLTGDPDKEYLGDGIAEELITTLTRGSDLKVPARTSAFSYKGRNVDIRGIARDLGVGAVLEGSVRVAGQRIRVTVQLIDAASGFHLWSQNYDRDLGDLFAIQDELAANIAAILQAKLGVVSADAPDPQAYELYLQARGIASRGTPEALIRGLALHEQAIALDPRFARALGDLAGTLTLAIMIGVLPSGRRAEARARAEEAARLDPAYWAPPVILAGLDSLAGRWLEAEAGFRAGIALDPNEPMALQSMATHMLVPCGHLRRGLELARQAVRLAPADINMNLSCALVASLCGDREARDAHFQTAIMLGLPEERGEVQILRSKIAREAGRFDEAADHIAKIFRFLSLLMGEGNADIVGPVFAALAGRSDAQPASRAIRDFVAAADREEGLWRFPLLAGQMIQWQVMLGSIDGAFDVTDRLVAYWRRSGHLAYTHLALLWAEEMRHFRRDPRFQHLIRALGMLPFWERHGPPDGYQLSGDRLVERP